MTTMKKLFALMLAVLMLLSVCAVAGAATITVIYDDPDHDENKDNETYTAYKIFDVVKNGDAIVYTIDQSKGWFSVLFNDNGTPKDGNDWFTATQIPGETGTWQISPAEDFKQENDPIVREAAAWLLANKGSNGGRPLQDGINTVDDGYYLVDSSLGTNLGLATTDFDMTIVEKNTYPGIDKKQWDDQSKAYGDDIVAVAVGDTINYQVTVTVPKSVKSDIVITDTMSSGLTFDGIDTVKTEAAELIQDNDWKVETGTDGEDFKITIHPTDAVKTLAGENGVGTIVFTFTATVNNNALTDSEKKNEVKLTYSNFTQSDSVNYETYAAGAIKYDGATATVGENGELSPKDENITYLEGTEFELLADNVTIKVSKDAAGYYYPNAEGTEVITSGEDGKILICGLDKDVTYQLKETKAPAGYNLLTTLVNLTLVSDADTITEEEMEKIENLAGATLPETGGIGTTIFYVAGGVLVLLAVVLLVTKRRVGENN